MKPEYLYFVIFLYLATVHECSGYKPLRGTQENRTSVPFDPENPPPEHGKSVYDPDIYHKYSGLQFQDQIEEEKPHKDSSPNMPSYPWRGGGHVPITLDDPDEHEDKKQIEYLIGYRDCTEMLRSSRDLFQDDLDDDETVEEEETHVEAVTEPHEGKRCKKKKHEDENTECAENEEEGGEGEASTHVTEKEEEKEKEDHQQSSESKKKCETCAHEARSFVLRGVGAASVLEKGYLLDNALSTSVNTATLDNFGGGDHFGDHYHPHSIGLLNDNKQAGGGDGAAIVATVRGSASSELQDDGGLGRLYYPGTEDDKEQTSQSKTNCESCTGSQEASSFSLRGVDAVSVVGREFYDDHHGDVDNVGGDYAGHHADDFDEENYYPFSDDLYKEEMLVASSEGGGEGGGGEDAGEDGTAVVAILDGGTSSEPPGEASRGYRYRPNALPGDEDAEEDGAHRRLTAEGCRMCAPCCVFLAEREAAGAAHGRRRRLTSECTPDDSERDYTGAECRSCHVRRRPPHRGVVLTCYECATQQADRSCKLGHENTEYSHYRVSAKFFLTTETNYTGEITATQHGAMLDSQSRQMLPPQQMNARASGRGRTPSTPAFIDSDSKDLYPFEVDEDDEGGDKHGDEDEDEETHEGKAEEEENENSKKKK